MSEPLWVFTWEHLDTLQPGLLICLFWRLPPLLSSHTVHQQICRLRLGGK